MTTTIDRAPADDAAPNEPIGRPRVSYAIADPRLWPPTEEAKMTDKNPVPETQGKAVRDAIEGDRNDDIDRWQDGFSRADNAKLAQEEPDAEQPAKPRAGLARDGGLVEGEG
jgi:hypothetical protein